MSVASRISLALALVAASPVTLALNLLQNGDMVGGTSGWNLSASGGGSAGSESFFGSPAGGSLRLQSYTFGAISHADQCVDVHKWITIDFALRKFVNGESGSGTHPFKLTFYDAADCGGNMLDSVALPEAGIAMSGDGSNPASGWIEVALLGTVIPVGTISARVDLDAIAGASGVSYYLLDHVQVGPFDVIFPDDFEDM